MKAWIRNLGAAFALALALPVVALAQATGQMTGLVTDTQGGVLPGVTVEVTNLATGAVRTAVTGTDGLYTIPLLQPGDYSVKASLSGFRAAQNDRVRVTVTETARVNFELGGRTGHRDRDRQRRGHAGRDQQRHPRHRHRRAEGGGSAA